jgi:hypothetical protein
MPSATLLRLSGLATIIGGVLFALAEIAESIFHPQNQPLSERFAAPSLQAIESASWLASVILLLGLIGLYVRQAQKAGLFGLIAFLVAFLGTALNVGSLWSGALLLPLLAEVAPDFLDSLMTDPPGALGIGLPISLYLFPVGWILFGVASLTARVFSWWAVLMVIVGLLLFPFVPVAPGALVGAGLIWMGYAVWRTREP